MAETDITPDQCRTARNMLGLTLDQLAALSSVSDASIGDFELGKRPLMGRTRKNIAAALISKGVVLHDDGSATVTKRPSDEAAAE